ncbi:dTMP kinase [soil metagenome]
MFVTFEGPEGSGKTTQVGRLAGRLRSAGRPIVVTREPGGTALGERIRSLLLDCDLVPAAETEAYLMTAARAEHVRQVIRPALARGDWVLCDRYVDSTLAYQGAGRGIDIAALRSLQDLATGGLSPDVTILLDIDVIEGLRRRSTLGDVNRIDQESVSFHQRVAAWYREEARNDLAERWLVVNANQPVECVEHEIWRRLSGRTIWTASAD